ncbi:Ger(x)C family spore germination protein ['Paenibacillus yunnanensis' Narsing Rao et al. 2020]|uniref:Ger(x)C family spore germination protein n=1 Tax=Paenibacillus tengchongensis TaxID=2608684 RepID=UPI00124C9D22|nr:Ger(x)C family spore germination protein [Paenibacillus tengchongensis]
MVRRTVIVSLCLLFSVLTSGCWSSKEIEDLALYTGLALDVGEPAPVEKEFEEKGGTYSKQNKVVATVQVVPIKSASGSMDKKGGGGGGQQKPYSNVSGAGDSILEIFRQFSIRRDRPIIGHHLKVIIISAELLKRQTISQLMDFVMRDNDIRPSTMVYISQGTARDTLTSDQPNEIPSFHIMGMIRNQSRTSKVLSPVTLARLDALTYSKRSFVLQNLIKGDGEVEFSGAGIVKGDTGHWIGFLNQEDTECVAWLNNEGKAGAIKAYDSSGEPMTYEIKAMDSKITATADGGCISFSVKLSSEGRFIETWNDQDTSSSQEFADNAGRIFEAKLAKMMQALLGKLQNEYQCDAAGFGDKLAIQQPAVWKEVKDHWDEAFSKAKIEITYDLKITDFGSFTE